MARKRNDFGKFVPWIIVGVILVILLLWFVGTYNSLVTKEIAVEGAWAQVETQYQRRMDLIPNLVETVKGYASHEEELFTEITQLRSQWGSAGSSSEQVAVANKMESALGRLLVVVENYPDLKANQNFLALQDELAGTENRISVERKRFNDAVGDYNTKRKKFPSNMVAGMFGFEAKEFFEADEGADVAPEISFE